MIEVSEIGKKYGSFAALQDVSFRVGRGEIIGLLGPNGAGKTTLIRILTGYHYPSEGQAIVAGINVVDDGRMVKGHIGYLPENAPVYHDMYVYEYLRFIALARGVAKELLEERIAKVVMQCALKEVLLKSIGNLSRGYRQRVGLAQAMIHDPDILILDEPTSGLDPNQVIEIRNLIRQLGEQKTVILSTHVMQEVEAMCNRVLIINQGRLVAQGTTAEIAAQLKGEARHICTFYLTGDAAPQTIPALRTKLAADSRIRSVVALEQSGDSSVGERLYRAEVVLSDDGDGKGGAGTEDGEALFHWAVENGAILTSLNSEKFKLEDIFVQLTNA